ncbi:MAG: hypothetical protein QOI44_1564 [Actinomycetota bacterium]|nr:hypothetical protein [Actinomycetota bacterium]
MVAVGLIGGAVVLASESTGKKKVNVPIQGPLPVVPAPSPAVTPSTPPTAVTPSTKSDLAAIVPSPKTVVIGPSPGEKGPLDVAEAQRVAAQLWATHVVARVHGDAPLMKAIEAGPALEADYGYLCYIGCRPPNTVASEIFVNVPRQTSWPVAFEATVHYDEGCLAPQRPCIDTLVLRQDARTRPWKIVFWTTAAGGNSPEERPALTVDGYAATPSAPRISGHDLLADYANYLDTLKRTGNPPALTQLAPGAFTTGLAASFYDPAERRGAYGAFQNVTYRVDPADATWTFATSQSTTLVCGTVRLVASFVGVDGRVMVQPPNFSGFGTDVLPGRYSSITKRGLHMVCFGLHAAASDPAYVIASYGDDTQVDTTPAP